MIRRTILETLLFPFFLCIVGFFQIISHKIISRKKCCFHFLGKKIPIQTLMSLFLMIRVEIIFISKLSVFSSFDWKSLYEIHSLVMEPMERKRRGYIFQWTWNGLMMMRIHATSYKCYHVKFTLVIKVKVLVWFWWLACCYYSRIFSESCFHDPIKNTWWIDY